jgi:hypothetical protein
VIGEGVVEDYLSVFGFSSTRIVLFSWKRSIGQVQACIWFFCKIGSKVSIRELAQDFTANKLSIHQELSKI